MADYIAKIDSSSVVSADTLLSYDSFGKLLFERITTFDNQVTFQGNSAELIIGTPSPFVDVRSFGAVGDGTTDDSTHFQNAITRVSSKLWGGGGQNRSTERKSTCLNLPSPTESSVV